MKYGKGNSVLWQIIGSVSNSKSITLIHFHSKPSCKTVNVPVKNSTSKAQVESEPLKGFIYVPVNVFPKTTGAFFHWKNAPVGKQFVIFLGVWLELDSNYRTACRSSLKVALQPYPLWDSQI